jgi:hypothetical protein
MTLPSLTMFYCFFFFLVTNEFCQSEWLVVLPMKNMSSRNKRQGGRLQLGSSIFKELRLNEGVLSGINLVHHKRASTFTRYNSRHWNCFFCYFICLHSWYLQSIWTQETDEITNQVNKAQLALAFQQEDVIPSTPFKPEVEARMKQTL